MAAVLSIRKVDLADAKAAVSAICRSVSDISAPCEAVLRRSAGQMIQRVCLRSCRRSRSLKISRSGGPPGNFGLQVWLSGRVAARSTQVRYLQRKPGAEVAKRSACSGLSGTPRHGVKGSVEKCFAERFTFASRCGGASSGRVRGGAT